MTLDVKIFPKRTVALFWGRKRGRKKERAWRQGLNVYINFRKRDAQRLVKERK